jgi:hypothetical protein
MGKVDQTANGAVDFLSDAHLPDLSHFVKVARDNIFKKIVRCASGLRGKLPEVAVGEQ